MPLTDSAVIARPHRFAAWHRAVVVVVLGFASGLPLALTGQAMQAWLSMEGLDVATIGFLSLVGLPYTFKFLWAPLMDRFDLPWLGRRRGWLVLTQLALAAALFVLASGITIVQVEQNVSMAMRLAHRACVLELGRIVAEGSPDELMKRPEIRQAYLGV